MRRLLFLTLSGDDRKDDTIRALITHAAKHHMGTTILVQHPRMAFGMQKDVSLWLRDKSPNWHLAMLIACSSRTRVGKARWCDRERGYRSCRPYFRSISLTLSSGSASTSLPW